MRVTLGDGVVLETAGPEHRDTLLDLARAFHAEDGHPLGSEGEAALSRLLADPSRGFAALLARGSCAVGYAVVCHGYSIEFGGPDAFLDDLFIVPEERGAGLGRRAIAALAGEAHRLGARALHLEIMPANPAERLYRRLGFADRGSRLLTLALGAGGGEDSR